MPGVASSADEVTSSASAGPVGQPASADDSTAGGLIPAGGFTSLQQAWDALKAAKLAVRAKDVATAQARQDAVAANVAVTRAKDNLTSATAALDAAAQLTLQRQEDVGQIARTMYMTGGNMPGTGMELLTLPSGIDLEAAVSTHVYLASASDCIVSAAADAVTLEASTQDAVAAAETTVESLTAAAHAAEQGVTDAEAAATEARLNVARVEQAVDAYVASIPAPAPASDCAESTSDQIAATIYAQATGLGLHDVAAVIGIGVGLGETGLANNTDGDCWGGSCSNGHTSSRGVFQQMWFWAPPGTAWSGQDGPTGGPGTPYDQFNGSNAWGPGGWAVADPRMDPAQAANMFFLGPNYGATLGLEDNALYQALRSTDPLDLSTDQMVTVAQQVQGFPVEHMGSYAANMSNAVGFFLRIKAGKIPVPAFRAPLAGMYKSATTTTSLSALHDLTPSPDRPPVTVGLPVRSDGMLLLGDSLMEGVATIGGVPPQFDGGPVTALHEIGIGTRAAIDKWIRQVRTGPSRILVSLGSNDSAEDAAGYAAQVDRLLAAAGPNRHVYWFTLHYRPVAALNAVLAAKAKEHPNLSLVDVRGVLTPTSGYLSPSDRYLHPNAAGYQAMWQAASNADRALSGYCPVWSLPTLPAPASSKDDTSRAS